jgi:hypothetical protein
LAGAADPPAELTWEHLESQGATIARVEVLPQNVFDPAKKGEKHWVGKAANFIHITTRRQVVEREFLFCAGEKVDARRIFETERNLRNLDFIREAAIVPVLEEDGSVTARVTTWDAWSLKLSGKYNQAGDNNAWNLKLHEANLLGFGKGVEFAYAKDVERTTRTLGYTDPRLFGTRWRFEAEYQDLSDGRTRRLLMERPFFSLETRWSAVTEWGRQESLLHLYNGGNLLYTAPSRMEDSRAGAGWAYSLSGRNALRLGFEFRWSGALYGPPTAARPGPLPPPILTDRRFRGPVLLWSLVQDHYEKFRDMKTVGFTEDYDLGWEMKAGLGCFSKGMGSYEDATYLELEAKKAWKAGENTLFLLESESRARRQADGWYDTITDTRLILYNRSLPRQTLAAYAGIQGGTRPDPEDWVYLGGFDGLRGYPDHYRAGDRSWTASFEDRIITPWVLWGIAQIGFVAYVDAGAIRQFSDGRWSPVYADVGAGLRLGDLKSAFGKVWLLTVAAPLRREPGMDRYQFVFGNVIRF